MTEGPIVPRLWPEETVVCLGTGPSLTPVDVEYCHGKARVIAVNDAWMVAPWADALYACDARWWQHYHGVPDFRGLKFALEAGAGRWPDVQVLQNTGRTGLETNPRGLRTGSNSGYQAVNLAVHLGARRIVLLGYDLQRTGGQSHFFGEHPPGLRQPSPFPRFLNAFQTLVDPLAALGIVILNCTRETALRCFPQMALTEALTVRERVCA